MDVKAKLFGYILGDGWIDKREQCGVSGDADSLENIRRDIIAISGDKDSAKSICTRETYSPKYNIRGTSSQFVTNIKFSRYMQSLGMPTGRRPEHCYLLPNWIINGSAETKSSFISGFYAAEGMIPSLQTNKRTPRPLTFVFSKDLKFADNSRKMARQFMDILKSIGFSSSVFETFEYTNSEKIKQTINLSNSEQQFLDALKMLDLDYCIKKEVRRKQLITYFELKQRERNKIIAVREAVMNHKKQGATIKELAIAFNLSANQVSKMICGRNKCHQVRGFPKFDQNFINTYCLSKTPLNDETLSDIVRQTTTCQALSKSSA